MLAIRLLEDDHQLADQNLTLPTEQIESARLQLEANRGKPAEEVIESERHALSMKLFETVSTVSTPPRDVREQLDAILTHRVWGYLILAGLLVSFFGMVYGVGMLLERPVLAAFEWLIAATGRWIDQSGLPFALARGLIQGVAGRGRHCPPLLAAFPDWHGCLGGYWVLTASCFSYGFLHAPHRTPWNCCHPSRSRIWLQRAGGHGHTNPFFPAGPLHCRFYLYLDAVLCAHDRHLRIGCFLPRSFVGPVDLRH